VDVLWVGNPGQRYAIHDIILFDVIDTLAERTVIAIRQREAEALCGTGWIGRSLCCVSSRRRPLMPVDRA